MALAEQAIAIDPSNAGGAPLHRARSFARLPDSREAAALLEELAATPCRFAPPSTDRPLALYGAGNLGRLARDFVKAVGHDFVMVVDRNARQMADDLAWSGVPLYHPDDVTDRDKRRLRLAVSIATSPYVPMERSLSRLGFQDIVPFYDWAENFRHRHPLSNGWFAPPLSADEQAKTAAVLSRWDDDVSRAHHLQFLAWRRLREEWTFDAAPVPDCARFFIPEIVQVLHNGEVFLDGGAHHGSVIEAFIKQTQAAFDRIVAVEPDATSRTVLLDQLQSWLPDDTRVSVLDCALAETEGNATFHAGLGYASQLSGTGHTQVAVRPVDALGLSPTFIKLHLEGSELDALKGARQTLARCRPIVAATVYHNADGIWKTAAWLMDALPGYRFLFRAHSWCGTGAVIYAIPDERAG